MQNIMSKHGHTGSPALARAMFKHTAGASLIIKTQARKPMLPFSVQPCMGGVYRVYSCFAATNTSDTDFVFLVDRLHPANKSQRERCVFITHTQ
jgi:hypothetical protein